MKFSEIFREKGTMLRKMWINQFAFSLFGIFVATPFRGRICIAAGIFSYLFYMSVVGFAVLDDAQKDKISFNAGRKKYISAYAGFGYAFIAFLPTILLMSLYTVFTFVPGFNETAEFIISLITRFVMGGEILGIDLGLTNYTYDAAAMIRVSDASDAVLFLSDHGFLHLIYSFVTPVILGAIYALGFKGIISVNTTETHKNNY